MKLRNYRPLDEEIHRAEIEPAEVKAIDEHVSALEEEAKQAAPGADTNELGIDFYFRVKYIIYMIYDYMINMRALKSVAVLFRTLKKCCTTINSTINSIQNIFGFKVGCIHKIHFTVTYFVYSFVSDMDSILDIYITNMIYHRLIFTCRNRFITGNSRIHLVRACNGYIVTATDKSLILQFWPVYHAWSSI